MCRFLSLLVILVSTLCAAATETERVRQELAESGGVFFALGASNSAGFGLRFGLRDRVLYQLATRNPEALAALRDRHQCLGLSVDRFFPTAFPILTETNVSDAQLRQAVVDSVTAYLASGCTVVMADLFSPREWGADRQAALARALPLRRMAEALAVADPTGRHTALVNRTLSELAHTEPRLRLFHFNDTAQLLLDDKTKPSRPLNDFFQHRGDDIHVNYAGQALLFNLFGRAALEKLTGTPVAAMAFDGDFGTAWQDEVLSTAARLSPRRKGEAKVLNRDELKADTHRLAGTKHKGVLTKAGDLNLIDRSVRMAVATQNASLSVSRLRTASGARAYELDLSSLAYTKVLLEQSASDPAVFVGYGSDYWGYAIGFSRVSSPAFTNYIFVLTELDETHAAIEWKIVPQLVVGTETQSIPKERVDHLIDPKGIWRPEIEKHLGEYDRLEYRLQTEIRWQDK